MSEIKVFKGELPENLNPSNREVYVVLVDDTASLLTCVNAYPADFIGTVTDDIVFVAQPLEEDDTYESSICFKKEGDTKYLVNVKNSKDPKATPGPIVTTKKKGKK